VTEVFELAPPMAVGGSSAGLAAETAKALGISRGTLRAALPAVYCFGHLACESSRCSRHARNVETRGWTIPVRRVVKI
jgi:hypothetical protein